MCYAQGLVYMYMSVEKHTMKWNHSYILLLSIVLFAYAIAFPFLQTRTRTHTQHAHPLFLSLSLSLSLSHTCTCTLLYYTQVILYHTNTLTFTHIQTSFGADILGHEFKVVRQSRPKTCDGCGEIIWQDALVCQTCQVTIHEESCKLKLNKPCTDSGDNVYEVCCFTVC